MAFLTSLSGRRRLVRRLKSLGAVSPATACALPGLSARDRRSLSRLQRIGAAREREPGVFHLDEMAWWRHRLHVRRLVVIVVSSALACATFIASL